jgi:chromosome partitioning protein
MIEETAARFKTKLYGAKIRECVAIKESQAVRKSIFAYAPRSNAAADYAALVDEIAGKEGKSWHRKRVSKRS